MTQLPSRPDRSSPSLPRAVGLRGDRGVEAAEMLVARARQTADRAAAADLVAVALELDPDCPEALLASVEQGWARPRRCIDLLRRARSVLARRVGVPVALSGRVRAALVRELFAAGRLREAIDEGIGHAYHEVGDARLLNTVAAALAVEGRFREVEGLERWHRGRGGSVSGLAWLFPLERFARGDLSGASRAVAEARRRDPGLESVVLGRSGPDSGAPLQPAWIAWGAQSWLRRGERRAERGSASLASNRARDSWRQLFQASQRFASAGGPPRSVDPRGEPRSYWIEDEAGGLWSVEVLRGVEEGARVEVRACTASRSAVVRLVPPAALEPVDRRRLERAGLADRVPAEASGLPSVRFQAEGLTVLPGPVEVARLAAILEQAVWAAAGDAPAAARPSRVVGPGGWEDACLWVLPDLDGLRPGRVAHPLPV